MYITQNDAHICWSVTNSRMHMRCPRHPQHVRFNVSLLSRESLPARWSHNSAGRPLTRIFDEVNAAGSRGGWGVVGAQPNPAGASVWNNTPQREKMREMLKFIPFGSTFQQNWASFHYCRLLMGRLVPETFFRKTDQVYLNDNNCHAAFLNNS